MERIKLIVQFFLKLRLARPNFAWVAFSDIKEVTGISKVEARQVCELLRDKSFLKYQYVSILDKEAVFLPREGFMESEHSDPQGAMFFLDMQNKSEEQQAQINYDELERLVGSDTELKQLARELRPKVSYNEKEAVLISDNGSLPLGPHNSKVIAERIFSVPFGTRISEDDFVHLLDDTRVRGEFKKASDAGYEYIYNCINRVNEKIEELTGITHFIQYKKGEMWVQ